ncbi:ABC transporter ATP-binding protein [Vallitalea guaymasensis]|uniref:ABC transporter ATP-binding protein n=1 Tax=Vallitalea guaymasensis TaxID=1185412 RepID=A0A8J8M8C7_9FIRM|nr:ABC transporter ATP-binding protein [Vallitalea guaymasensis]QUH28005.1 ABC transporter ATP-binding protein [Vallitalea guaymasensis]
MFKTIKRIIIWTGNYKKSLYIGFVYSFLVTIFSAMPIMATGYTLDLVLKDMRGEITLEKNLAFTMLIFIILTVLLRFYFSYLRAKSQESVGYEIAAKQRIKIGEVLKRVSLGYFNKNNTGDVSATLTSELSVLELQGMKMIDKVVNGYINIIATILCLAFFNIEIALISLAGAILSFIFVNGISRKCKENAPILEKAQIDMTSDTIEYIRGMHIVKAFKQDGVAIDKIKKSYSDSKGINIKVEKNFVPYNCLHLLSLRLASVLIVLISGRLVLDGKMDLPIMLMIGVFSFTIFSNVEGVNDAAHLLRLIDNTLNKLEKMKNADFIDKDGKDIALTSYNIRFDHVRFAYDNKDIINDVSFNIPQNTTTAIIGPSGSGKTTLCSLLARFYDVNSGKISIGGVDIRKLTCDSLLSNMSMVFQNVYLFHDTIKNNIRFGNPSATDAEIKEAAKKACCHDFIMDLSNGYDTMIGEGGSSLSGGEKQRISIARAILKDAPIVILDEATASVDPENEHYIQEAISSLTHGKTIIIIAHRLATIQNADQILVVDNGNIAQKGTHEQLYKQEGIYRRFLTIRERAESWSI